MRLLAGPRISDLVGQYVCEQVGVHVTRTPFEGLAIYDEQGNFCCGIVISNFRGTDCELSVAAETPNWARKGICRKVFEYIFYRMGCVRCTVIIQKIPGTKRARRFAEGMGFVLEGNLRLAYDGKTDALVYGLLRAECRFLKENSGGSSGKKVGTITAASTGPVRDSGGANDDEPGNGNRQCVPEPG